MRTAADSETGHHFPENKLPPATCKLLSDMSCRFLILSVLYPLGLSAIETLCSMLNLAGSIAHDQFAQCRILYDIEDTN